MLHNEPVDILDLASRRLHYWDQMLNITMQLQYSADAQRQWDEAWVQRSIAADDMDAVQALISELAR